MEYEQMSMLKQLNNIDYTYKSSDLIMSSYNLSITQQRIINLACKKIQPIYIEKRLAPKDLETVLGAMNFSLIQISTSEYKSEYNIKGNNVYDTLEEECDKLYKNDIKYFGDNNKLIKKRWVSTSVYDRKEGIINLTFNPDIILDLLVFNGKFVALFLDMSQNIKSKYVFRLYEILKTYAYLGEYKVLVEELRFLLDITEKYNNIAELNRKIVKPSIEIMNKFSDINVKYNSIRDGKSTKWLKFNIILKSKSKLRKGENLKLVAPTAFNEISQALEKYGVKLTSEDAETLFNKAIEVTKEKFKDMNAVDYLLNKLKVLDNYILTNNIGNVIGLLIDSMQKDYQNRTVEQKKQPNSGFNNFEPRPLEDRFIELRNKILSGQATDEEEKEFNEMREQGIG